MSEGQRLVYLYLPSGYVGAMEFDEAKKFVERHPQALAQWVDEPPSQQAIRACRSAERRETARNRVRYRTDPSLSDILMGLTSLMMVAISLYALWIVFR